jgi:dipeptidyl-peptidase-4
MFLPRFRRAIYLAALAALFLSSFAAAPVRAQAAPGAKQLTVERIWGRPSLSGSLTQGIEWSPDGRQLSYFRRVAGKNEIVTMDVATGEQRVLVGAEKLASLLPSPKGPATQRTGLGRVPPQRYSWAPDGSALLFVGESSLVWYDLRTQESRSLLLKDEPIQDAKISPDSHWVSFLRGHNVWVVSADGSKETQVTRGGNEDILEGELDWVYPEELDLHTAYWWSPDSSRIAFLEMDERPVTKYPIVNYLSYTGETQMESYPKAGDSNPVVRLGVMSASGGKTQWIDTGEDKENYLPRVEWLPDSKRLLVERLNRAQNRLDLMLADSTSGAARPIVTETDKYWINIQDDLYIFSDGERFLWSSERSGFRHLYLYDISGNLIEQLTQGNWSIVGTQGFGPGAVNHPAVDERRGYVYFLSSRAKAEETQLHRVSLADKKIEQITNEPGVHSANISPSTDAFVDTHSTQMRPPRQDVRRTDGTLLAVLNENRVVELAEYHLSPAEFLNLKADDGTPLQAMMVRPPDFDPARKYPVIVYLYGGPGVQAVRNAWGGQTTLWNQMMAEKGFVIFTLDNRGSAGRGHAFEMPIYHHFGELELSDQLAGVRYLKSLPYVDGTRMGIWGWSYGGFMTLNAMFNAPDVFKAGFAGAPVTDWRQYDTIYTERYMGLPQENPDGYKNSSPVNHANQLKGKLLIAHGTGDDNVHFGNTAALADRLIEADKYAEIAIYPGRGHPISDPPARIQLFQRVTKFFLENLQ